MGYIKPDGTYYEGDQADLHDQPVPQRPSLLSDWVNGAWVDSLDKFKAAQITTLSQACQNQIYAGFTSSALSTAHTYPAKDKDQVNLSASVTASLLPGLPANWTTPFWCADPTTNPPTWAFVQHTAAQIQQVGTDGKAAIVAALLKNSTLAAQVMNATTVAAVLAIVW